MLASNTHTPEIIIKHSGLLKASIVVSKNVAKKAVDRNRIKRIIKEAQRVIGPKAASYSVIVKKNIADLKTDQVKELLIKHLNKHA